MAAPATSPHNHDHDRDSLAQVYLNDPNFDVDAEFKRRSNDSHKRPPQPVIFNTSSSIRRRPNPGPPPPSTPTSSSPPRSGFPLIPHSLPNPPPLSTQPPYNLPAHDRHPHPLHNFTANPEAATWSTPVSISISSFISDSKLALNGPNSYHGHSTDIEDEYYDMESITPSTSSRPFSRNTYGYDNKKGSNRDHDDMEMDIRSELDFEEYVFSFSSTIIFYPKRSNTPDHLAISFSASLLLSPLRPCSSRSD